MAAAAVAVTLATIGASAHEVQPAVADVTVGPDTVTIDLRVAVEPVLAGIDLGAVGDTDESPLSADSDALRALPPQALADRLRADWPDLADRITLRAGDTALAPELASVEVPPVGDVAIRRDTALTVLAHLPDDGSDVRFGWDPELGALIVRQGAGASSYEDFLTDGTLSEGMPRGAVAERPPAEVIARHVVAGFDRIVLERPDHALFVLGLFLYALAWRPLLWQVAAFTAAHTATLALATTGLIAVPGGWTWLVGATIAASVVYVGVDNILGDPARRGVTGPRVAAVSGFGLLHGLGFAAALSELGPGRPSVLSIVAFDAGVVLGHLVVVVVAFGTLVVAFRLMPAPLRAGKPEFRAVSVVASFLIAAMGLLWIVDRVISV